MRILHVTYSLAADQGGPTMVTTRVAAAQADLGHEVTILTRQSVGKETEFPATAGAARVKIERIPRSSVIAKISGRDSLPRLRELIARHDVVHVHNIWDPILIHAVKEARRQNKPAVLSPHGILTRWALSEKRLKKAIALGLLYRRAIAKYSLVHALSSFEREEVAAFGFQGPVVVVPNGVFLEEIDPLPEKGRFLASLVKQYPPLRDRNEAESELRDLRIPVPLIEPGRTGADQAASDPFVLFLSRLHPIKGLDILLWAFQAVVKNVPNARLVIVGPDFGMKDTVEDLALGLDIADRVHLTGPIFGRGKYEAMVDCACFCLPSGHEAFSVAIAEAMACRAAVVISPECHFPEAAEAGAGLVVERDATKLAAALESLLTDEPKRRALGQTGRKLIEDRFTWTKVAEALVAAYEKAEKSKALGVGKFPNRKFPNGK